MMGYFFPFILFLLGLCVGSFVNVVIQRLPKRASILRKRSHCESCKKSLKWYDMIPVLSFVNLAGKCRYCHSPISLQYPIVELVTGLLFIWAIRVIGGIEGIGNVWLLGYHLFIISALIAIFFIDLKYGIIPDKIIYLAVLVSFLYSILYTPYFIQNNLLSAVGSLLFFLLIFLATRGRGMGFGDAKLSFLMGLILGFPAIVIALYSAFLTGAFASIILVLLGKKKIRGGTIPFGPFLVLGTLIALFLGKYIQEIVEPFF